MNDINIYKNNQFFPKSDFITKRMLSLEFLIENVCKENGYCDIVVFENTEEKTIDLVSSGKLWISIYVNETIIITKQKSNNDEDENFILSTEKKELKDIRNWIYAKLITDE